MCSLFRHRVAELLEAKATSDSKKNNFSQVILSFLYQNVIYIFFYLLGLFLLYRLNIYTCIYIYVPIRV